MKFFTYHLSWVNYLLNIERYCDRVMEFRYSAKKFALNFQTLFSVKIEISLVRLAFCVIDVNNVTCIMSASAIYVHFCNFSTSILWPIQLYWIYNLFRPLTLNSRKHFMKIFNYNCKTESICMFVTPLSRRRTFSFMIPNIRQA